MLTISVPLYIFAVTSLPFYTENHGQAWVEMTKK